MGNRNDTKDSRRQSGLYATLKTTALSTIAALGLMASPAKADDDIGEYTRRRHVPVMLDTPIRLEYPAATFAAGVGGNYHPTHRIGGAELHAYTPWAAAWGRYNEGSTRIGRDQSYEGRFSVGAAREDFDINLSLDYLNLERLRRGRSSSQGTDSDGLLNTTDSSERRKEREEDYSFTGEFRRRFGPYGSLMVYGSMGRRNRREEVDVNTTTSVQGVINVPGAPEPVTIDTTVNSYNRAEVRRVAKFIDLAAVYDLAVFLPDGVNQFGIGPFGSLSEYTTRAKVFDGTTTRDVLNQRAFRRSYGADFMLGLNHPKDGRIFLSGRAGTEWGAHPHGRHVHRFTGQGTLVLTGRPFDQSTQYSLSGQVGGMGGEEFYQMGLFMIKHQQDEEAEADHQRLFNATYGLEALLSKETSLRSGNDQRFGEARQREIILNLYQFDMHRIAGQHGMLGFTGYFQKINSDRVGGSAILTLPYLFGTTDEGGNQLCPNIALMGGGFWGQDGHRRQGGLVLRDYHWFGGISWMPDLDNLDLQLWGRVERLGTPGGVETRASAGLTIMFGYESHRERPGYDKLFEGSNNPHPPAPQEQK